MNADKMQGDGSNAGAPGVVLVAMEMSLKSWRLAMAPAGAVRHRQTMIAAGSYVKLEAAVAEGKERFGLPARARVIVCYEAGREGFHPCRVLSKAGHTVWVVDSSSIEVDRRKRRAKNDVIDAGKLLSLMQRQLRGEGAFRVVRVPTREQEDLRQRSREREELRVERGRVRVRMASLLFAQGMRDFPKSVRTIERWLKAHVEGLPGHLRARLEREFKRLCLVSEQLQAVEAELRRSTQSMVSGNDQVAARLCELRGIGERSAWVMAEEMFGWREFRNRREVGTAGPLR